MFVIMASSSLHFQTSNRVQAKKASPFVTDLSDQVSLPHIMSENMSESRWKTRFEPVISFFVPASVTWRTQRKFSSEATQECMCFCIGKATEALK